MSKQFGKVQKLNGIPHPPKNVEVTWTVITPFARPELRFVVVAFYSSNNPEYKPGKNHLQDHILEVFNVCRNRYQNVHFIAAGDINQDSLDSLASIDMEEQIRLPTRGLSHLDHVWSTLSVSQSWTQPPLAPNIGKRSDHRMGFCDLILPPPSKKWQTVRKRIVRGENVEPFGNELQASDWQSMRNMELDDQVDFFTKRLDFLLDKYFPFKTFRHRIGNWVFFTGKVRHLHKKKNKIYRKEGNSQRFRNAKREFRIELAKARKSYFQHQLDQVGNNHKRWHSLVSNLGRHDGRIEDRSGPQLQIFNGKTDQQVAEMCAAYIESITEGYETIDPDHFHQAYPDGQYRSPTVDEVEAAIRSLKLPAGKAPSDPPPQIIKPLARIFAVPLSIIIGQSFSTGRWPSAFKHENITMIEKKPRPESLKDLRPIALTSVWSKLMEKCIRDDILSDVQEHLHLMQHGGLSKVSVSHYMAPALSRMIAPSEEDHLTVVTYIDYSNAFMKINHSQVIQAAANLGLRQPLVRLLSDYLSNRKSIVRWNSTFSAPHPVRGGSGQGTLLSVLLFIIALDELLKELELCFANEENGVKFPTILMAFVDDCAIMISYPRHLFEGSFLCDGRLKKYTSVINNFCNRTGMVLNKNKTSALVVDFAKSRKIQFPPGSLTFETGEEIAVHPTAKILGITLDSELTLSQFVKEKVKKSEKCLWFLRRLKQHCPDQNVLIRAYYSYVRSVLEFGLVPTWSMLDAGQIEKLERVQKQATKIILSSPWFPSFEGFIDYPTRLEILGMESIEQRVTTQLRNFAINNENDPRFTPFLVPNTQNHSMSLRNRPKYRLPKARTERMQKAPMYKIAQILNEHYQSQ